MGSTAISLSFSWSHSTAQSPGLILWAHSGHSHRPNMSKDVRRLGFNWDKEPFLGTGEQPIDHAFIRLSREPYEAVLPTVEAFDLEFLSGLDVVLLPEFGW